MISKEAIDALNNVALQIRNLGNADAATHMGGLEALGLVFKEGFETQSYVLSDVADAIRDLAKALAERGE